MQWREKEVSLHKAEQSRLLPKPILDKIVFSTVDKWEKKRWRKKGGEMRKS